MIKVSENEGNERTRKGEGKRKKESKREAVMIVRSDKKQ